MNQYLKVSIVTPSLNQGRFIERTILSVLEQEYPDIEYVIIDGGSTDNTLEILKRYKDKLFYISEPDEGQSDAINKGLHMATGEIMAYLNSDDTYKLSAISTVAQEFLRHPDIDLIYGDCNIVDEEHCQIGIFEGIKTTYRRLLMRSIASIPQPAAFWRRKVLEDVGYFDENLHYAMDTDFFIRVLKRHKALYTPVIYANHQWHSESKSSTQREGGGDLFRRDRMKILKKHGEFYVWYYLFRYRMLTRLKSFLLGQKPPFFKPKRGVIRFFNED